MKQKSVTQSRSKSRPLRPKRQLATRKTASAGKDDVNLQSMKRRLVREQIIRSATVLFADRGIRNVSIYDIAKSLGYTKMSVYYYFRSKGELLWSIFSSMSAQFIKEAETIAKTFPDPVERLAELTRMHVRFTAEHKGWTTVFYRDATALPAERQSEVRRITRRGYAIFHKAHEDGIASGQMRPLPTDAVINVMSGACNWFINWMPVGDPNKVDEMADLYVEIFTRGLAYVGATGGAPGSIPQESAAPTPSGTRPD